MRICICCSKKYFPIINEFLNNLNDCKNEFFTPALNFNGEVTENSRKNLAEVHHKKITRSDVIYVYNPDNEIGKNTTLEMGYALALNKKIFALKKVGDLGIDCFIQKLVSLEDLKEV